MKAVLYRYRAGIPWRDLPVRFGDFRVVHRFSRQVKRGAWKEVSEHLIQDAHNEQAMIDASMRERFNMQLGKKAKSCSHAHPVLPCI